LDTALILIVEDEPLIADVLDAYFVRDGYRTVQARDGEVALQHHHMLAPDLVVLDVKLPRRDGFEVLATIRARGNTPVIMVTALDDDLEILSALKIGADDYVTKPFNPLEVVARAKAVLRRMRGRAADMRMLRVAELTVDIEGHRASLCIDPSAPHLLDLSPTEFRILERMAHSPHRAHTRAELLDACLQPDTEALERTVDSHVSKLRRKLERAGGAGWLENVRGVGWRLHSH